MIGFAFESESAGVFAIHVHFQCTRLRKDRTPTLVHAITSTRTCELCIYVVLYLYGFTPEPDLVQRIDLRCVVRDLNANWL